MTGPLWMIFGALLLSAWCLVDNRNSFWDKIKILTFVIAVYVAVRLMQGLSFEQILAPLMK